MAERLHVGTRKGVFRVERRNGSWDVSDAWFLGDNCSIFTRDTRDGAMYAALNHGHFGCKLHRSRDDGATWEEVGCPEYPTPPAGYEEPPNPMTGKPVAWKLQMIWSIVPGGPDQPGLLWCGTLPGGLFISQDHGDSWTMVRSLWDDPRRIEWFGGGYDVAGIHSLCVDPRDSNTVTMAVSCGGVWRTTDCGETWALRAKGLRAEYMPPERAYDENIQDAHLIVQSRGAPDCFWVQHHNGVFRSTDDGATWTEIEDLSPSAFGFAVVVHPNDGGTAWVAPAIKDEKRIPADGAVVVNRTRDGGASWETLRNGLPQTHAYDLVFRHAMDIDTDGVTLAMGSTTGSLWISEDQGDRWTLASAHLPPIHDVSFA